MKKEKNEDKLEPTINYVELLNNNNKEQKKTSNQ